MIIGMKIPLRNKFKTFSKSCTDSPLKVYIRLSCLYEAQYAHFSAYSGTRNGDLYDSPLFSQYLGNGLLSRIP